MLEHIIHKYDRVITSDNVELGRALRIHHWPADTDPTLIQYASYLEVWSINLGGHVFIPTEFIDQVKAGIVILAVPLATVQHETWDRMPNFIAGRISQREELPEGTLAPV